MRTVVPWLLGFTLVLGARHVVAAGPGALDTSFGLGGRVTAAIQIRVLVVQPDGKIVTAGGNDGDFGLARFDASGAPDPSFGGAGVATTSFGGTPAVITALALQPDGRLLAGGSVGSGFQLARYDAAGSLDATFGAGGLVPLPLDTLDGYSDDRMALALEGDGGIVVGGRNQGRYAVARFLPDGTADGSFGAGGLVTTSVPGFFANVTQLLVQPDGRIVAFGQPRVARYDTGGALDPTFGTGGLVTPPPAIGSGQAWHGALLPDGRLLAVGAGAFFRMMSDGTPDVTFGAGGTATTLVDPLIYASSVVTLDPDGKMVTAGDSLERAVAAVSRFLPGGAVDTSFGRAGSATPLVAVDEDEEPALALQTDGKIVYGRGTTILRLFGGTCGNGIPEGGEDCDDGNLLDGDGCDAHCCTADADGDGLCDAVDPCTAGVASAVTKVRVTSGGTRLSVAGDAMVFPPPALDPVANGFRILLDAPAGNGLDVTIAGGTYLDPPKLGWKVRIAGGRTTWTWRDRSHVPSPGRLETAVVSAAANGRLKVRVKGKTFGHYPVDFAYTHDRLFDLSVLPIGVPLTARLVLDPPAASSARCIEGTAAPLP